jgi:hypothetical protein
MNSLVMINPDERASRLAEMHAYQQAQQREQDRQETMRRDTALLIGQQSLQVIELRNANALLQEQLSQALQLANDRASNQPGG